MNQHAAMAVRHVPAHVDPARVIDFDVFRDSRYGTAHGPHQALHESAAKFGRGLFWSPHNGGHWLLTSHELIFEAWRTPELFSSSAVSALPPMPDGGEPWLPPLSLDAPEHMKYRMPLIRAFSPARIKSMEDDIRALAGALIDAFRQAGHCEFVDALAEALPVIIFMKTMGLDLARLKEFRSWARMMASPDTSERVTAAGHIAAAMAEVIAARRVKREDDLFSYLLDCEIDGRKLDDRQMQGVCLLLFSAGLDTVASTLTTTMDHIARDQALQDRLRREPHMIPEAVEELLRLYSVTFASRKVTRDVDFHGVRMRAGDLVLLVIPLANSDPSIFAGGDGFDIDREFKTHLTFGAGPHRCLGSHLARLELVTFFEEWFKRMPNVRLDPARKARFSISMVIAFDRLDLVWDAI
jgi:cytochrome P450